MEARKDRWHIWKPGLDMCQRLGYTFVLCKDVRTCTRSSNPHPFTTQLASPSLGDTWRKGSERAL